jgi:hypothetical protein
VAQALILLPLTLPVLPEATMARSPMPGIRKDFADTVGWHDLVAQVAAVYDALPADERGQAVILTDNYGEAGAINTYGPPLGLPTAVSGELSYYYWKPATLDGPVVAVGVDESFLTTLFDSAHRWGRSPTPTACTTRSSGHRFGLPATQAAARPAVAEVESLPLNPRRPSDAPTSASGRRSR